MVVALVAGAVLAWLFVASARRQGPRIETCLYAIGLIVAAAIYAGLALAGEAEPRWIAAEFAGLLLFAGCTWLGWRRSPWWLAAGWTAHAVWDAGLHLVAGTPAFVPSWYPAVCLGFDFVIAAAVTLQARAQRGLATEAA